MNQKPNKKELLFSIFQFRSFRLERFAALISRNGGRALTGIFVRMLPVIAGKTTKSLVRVISQSLSRFSFIASTQGIPGLVKYLKAVSVCTQQSIAGYRTVTGTRVSVTKSGLPRVIPVKCRRMIRLGSTAYMRLSLTLSSLYRDFIYESPVKLDSIIAPYSGKFRAVDDIKGYVPNFINLFIKPAYPTTLSIRKSLKDKFLYIPLSKSSPQASDGFSSTHPFVLIKSARVMPLTLIKSLRILTNVYENTRFINLLELMAGKEIPDKHVRPRHPYVGKLGLKQEAAGKMRVFAMVDPWSQLALRPFHLILFKILSK